MLMTMTTISNLQLKTTASAWFAATLLLTSPSFSIAMKETPVEYGVDVSWPMQSWNVSINYPWLPHNMDPSLPTPEEYKGMPIQPLGNQQEKYNNYLKGCMDHYRRKGSRCLDTEKDRIAMSKRQPQSMQNYTDAGFKKIRAPEKVMKLLTDFWERNKDEAQEEKWYVGNTYTNHWESPTEMIGVDDESLEGGGNALKDMIWDAARDTIQDWTGQELTPCSLYGIRIYPEGSILATHVDRLPLVSSAIINVAQDVDEDWPIEVYGHDGKAVNVTMQPGDMVLYESHSVLHGRPFPLKGRFYANVFIHFEPVGHSLRHEEKEKSVKEEDEEDELPPYIIPGSPEEAEWRRYSKEDESEEEEEEESFQTGSTAAHKAVQDEDLESLKQVIEEEGSDLVHAKDSNGFTPLHEAILSGSIELVSYLMEIGGDVNERTHHGEGGTPLWWAIQEHGEEHPLVQFLEDNEAEYIEPEL